MAIDMPPVVRGYLEAVLFLLSDSDIEFAKKKSFAYTVDTSFRRADIAEAEKDCSEFARRAGGDYLICSAILVKHYGEDVGYRRIGQLIRLSATGTGTGFRDCDVLYKTHSDLAERLDNAAETLNLDCDHAYRDAHRKIRIV